jgi:hypothetical protein
LNYRNLQLAVGAYFDLTEDQSPLDGVANGMIWTHSMSLVDDISSSDDVSVPPNTKFVKRWRIRNSGREAWPPGTHLRYRSGQKNMCMHEQVIINPVVQVRGQSLCYTCKTLCYSMDIQKISTSTSTNQYQYVHMYILISTSCFLF